MQTSTLSSPLPSQSLAPGTTPSLPLALCRNRKPLEPSGKRISGPQEGYGRLSQTRPSSSLPSSRAKSP